MTIGEWLSSASMSLQTSSSPQLDAELLLGAAYNNNRAWVLAHRDDHLDELHKKTLMRLLSKRVQGLSVPHITGKSHFYGREFAIDKHVLSPRPESEIFIECLSKVLRENGHLKTLIDIGTGSGILAITAKLEFPGLHIIGTDISKSALTVAQKNVDTHNVNIALKQQNLLDGDTASYDIVLANLPYVPIDMRHPSIAYEPSRALYSGTDGLNHYRRLFSQLTTKQIRCVLTESLESQHSALTEIAQQTGYQLVDQLDLIQVYRKS